MRKVDPLTVGHLSNPVERLGLKVHEQETSLLNMWTTNDLTTAVLVYTLRAGITAGAGTRLFL